MQSQLGLYGLSPDGGRNSLGRPWTRIRLCRLCADSFSVPTRSAWSGCRVMRSATPCRPSCRCWRWPRPRSGCCYLLWGRVLRASAPSRGWLVVRTVDEFYPLQKPNTYHPEHPRALSGRQNEERQRLQKLVILSERSESKNPPKFGARLKAAMRVRPCGDPSTRSSNSLAQGDMLGVCQWKRVEESPEAQSDAARTAIIYPQGSIDVTRRTCSLRVTGRDGVAFPSNSKICKRNIRNCT